MFQIEFESVCKERDQWYKRACEFKALALAARQEFENDDTLWFEQAYRDALDKYRFACLKLDENVMLKPVAA